MLTKFLHARLPLTSINKISAYYVLLTSNQTNYATTNKNKLFQCNSIIKYKYTIILVMSNKMVNSKERELNHPELPALKHNKFVNNKFHRNSRKINKKLLKQSKRGKGKKGKLTKYINYGMHKDLMSRLVTVVGFTVS